MNTRRQKVSKRTEELDGRPQAQRFIEAAREIGADEDAEAFKAKLALIARQKVNDEAEQQGKINGK